jgi:hypothetical protein
LQLNSKVGNILAKATVLLIKLNIDVAHIASRAPTHPSHSQTSRLASYSLPSSEVPPSPAPPSMCEALTSSSFSALSLTTPTPLFTYSSLALALSAVINRLQASYLDNARCVGHSL